MIPDGYRLEVSYVSDKQLFVASIPELKDIRATGATRAEALTQVEEQLEAAFRKAAENGTEMPKPIDGQEFSGEVALELSPSLHRELAFLAARDKIEINQLAVEMLAAGAARRIAPNSQERPRPRSNQSRSGRQNRRPGKGKNYFDIMDDKASFIEYVRGLDNKGGGRGGNTRGGGSRGGGGGSGGRGRRS